jgi:hypothetical protein
MVAGPTLIAPARFDDSNILYLQPASAPTWPELGAVFFFYGLVICYPWFYSPFGSTQFGPWFIANPVAWLPVILSGICSGFAVPIARTEYIAPTLCNRSTFGSVGNRDHRGWKPYCLQASPVDMKIWMKSCRIKNAAVQNYAKQDRGCASPLPPKWKPMDACRNIYYTQGIEGVQSQNGFVAHWMRFTDLPKFADYELGSYR